MAGQMERPKDVAGGLLVVAIGAGFLWFGSDLRMGSSFRMGPGYFPTVLSWILIALGAVMTLLALRGPRVEGSFGHVPWRGLVLIIGAVLVFGLVLRALGLLPALVIVVLATAWASRYATWRASVALAAGLAVFCTFLFVQALGLPLPVLGPWLDTAYWSGPPEPVETAPAGEAPATNPPAQQ